MDINLSYTERTTGKNFKDRYVLIYLDALPAPGGDKPVSPIWKVLSGFGCGPDNLGVKLKARNLNGQVCEFTRMEVFRLIKRKYEDKILKQWEERK